MGRAELFWRCTRGAHVHRNSLYLFGQPVRRRSLQDQKRNYDQEKELERRRGEQIGRASRCEELRFESWLALALSHSFQPSLARVVPLLKPALIRARSPRLAQISFMSVFLHLRLG